jgi:hypothetical protein
MDNFLRAEALPISFNLTGFLEVRRLIHGKASAGFNCRQPNNAVSTRVSVDRLLNVLPPPPAE